MKVRFWSSDDEEDVDDVEVEVGPQEIDDDGDGEEDPIVKVVADDTMTFEYTEHVGEARFASGFSKDFTFDKMRRESDAIILKDYADETTTKLRSAGSVGGRFVPPKLEPEGARAFVTIPTENLEYFETVERIDREIVEDFHAADQMPLSRAKEAVAYAEMYVDEIRIEEADEEDE